MYKDNYLYHMNEKDYFKYNNRQFGFLWLHVIHIKAYNFEKKLIYLLSVQYLRGKIEHVFFLTKVVIEGVVGSYLGDIAIDDVSMTPGCILMNSPGYYSVTLCPRVEADTYNYRKNEFVSLF